MKFIARFFSSVLVASSFLFSAMALQAEEAKPAVDAAPVVDTSAQAAQTAVESVSTQLFALVKEKNAKKTPDEEYFKQVETVLEPVVGFTFIANSVMGKKTYESATPEQREQFLKVFKDGMVKSLAKGILGYAESKVTYPGTVVDPENAKRALVKQELSVADGANQKLDYTMMQDKTGNWKLINVVLNGVNLGKSFSGQFAAGLKKHQGDIDKVVANWLGEA
jgi:phospholipid transport system substrate-binding protein